MITTIAIFVAASGQILMAANTLSGSEQPVAVTQPSSARYRHWPFRCCPRPDTQGQSAPVFALATLFGFDLMPRIRNFKDLIFFRPNEHLIYPHVDALFGERGRNVIDWKLIERRWQDLMRVAISISEGRLSSATLMRQLRSNSRKNRIYKVFREVGRRSSGKSTSPPSAWPPELQPGGVQRSCTRPAPERQPGGAVPRARPPPGSRIGRHHYQPCRRLVPRPVLLPAGLLRGARFPAPSLDGLQFLEQFVVPAVQAGLQDLLGCR